MVINRVNKDSVINNNGNLLLDMCKTSNLFWMVVVVKTKVSGP